MAYNFTHIPFKWSRTGLDATAAEKALGFQGGMALPAAFLNQAWTKTYEALKETQRVLSDGSWLGTEADLDDDSTNPVQNRAIYEELAKKVDIDGSKQLTDENFTLGFKQLFTMVDTEPTALSPYLLSSGAIFEALSNKQDAEAGKGLSDNDFTTAMKTAVDSQAGLVVDSALDDTSTHLLQNKVATAAINELKNIIYPKLTVTAFPNDVVTLSTGTTALTVTPDNTGIFTVSLPKLGSWTIAQTHGGQLYSGVVGVYKAGTSYSLDITFDTVLDNNSPAKIAAAANMGIAKNLWSVGDKVGIDLNGTVGSLAINGKYYAFILGFDHNSSIEGTNTIHFQFGKTSDGTKTIAFVDSQYNTQQSGNYFTMNTSNTNSGGWASSRMRNTLMPQFKAAMPSEWRDIISPCTKYSDNTGGGSDTASYVTSTTDDIFLLSEWEVRGARTYANSKEKNYQAQYDYYANGNSKIFYKYNDTSSACIWWLRSVFATSTRNFCYVDTDGYANGYSASYSYGLASGFMVGGNAA